MHKWFGSCCKTSFIILRTYAKPFLHLDVPCDGQHYWTTPGGILPGSQV